MKHIFDEKAHLLIFGGSGFFGRSIVRYLSALSVAPTITIVCRNPDLCARDYQSEFNNLRLNFVQADVLDQSSLAKCPRADFVIHAATDSTNGTSLSRLRHFDQIVFGTKNVLEWAVDVGVKRLLFCSSGAVYGDFAIGSSRVTETCMQMPDPLSPASAYGVAKRAAENLCALYQDKVEIVIARCFAFSGRDLPLKAHFALGNFVYDALYNTEITIQGDGTAVRSYMDQQDLSRWLLALLLRGQSQQAYNVGSDYGVSIFELAKLVQELLAPNKKIIVKGALVPSEKQSVATRSFYVPSVTKVKNELNLNIECGLSESILSMAKWANRV